MLANLTVPRRPGRGPTVYPDPLADRDSAAQALGIARPSRSELRALHELHAAVVELVDALLSGRRVTRAAARLTSLAAPSAAAVRLEADERRVLRTRFDWSDPAATPMLARRVAVELGEIDVTRLKRCARTACDLVFYDTTRSGTRRWHAESPCGLRERQERHRAAPLR